MLKRRTDKQYNSKSFLRLRTSCKYTGIRAKVLLFKLHISDAVFSHGSKLGTRLNIAAYGVLKERQPQLALRRGDATAHIRMDSTTNDAIVQYYNLLEKTLLDHNVSENSAQIYNMDESGMPLVHRPPNVIARRGQKKVRYRVAGKQEQISVIGCVKAIGQSIPPMVIFENNT